MYKHERINKRLKASAIIVTALVCVFIITCAVLFPNEPLSFDNEAPLYMSEGWVYVKADGTEVPITLPADLDLKKGEEYTVKANVSLDKISGNYLGIRTSSQSLSVKYNGEVIYTAGKDSKLYIGNSPGSYWNLVELPSKLREGVVELTFSAYFEDFAGIVPIVYGGSKGAIMYEIFSEYGLGFVFDVILLILGMVLFFFYWIPLRRVENASALRYLSSFAFWLAIWFLGESKMLQFFLSNHFLITCIPYIALSLFPLFLLLYFEQECDFQIKFIPMIIKILLMVNTLLICILQLCGIDFYLTVVGTNVLLFCSLLVVLIMLLVETFVFRNKTAKFHLISLVLFGITALIEFVFYFSSNYAYTTDVLKIGAVVFLGIDAVATTRRFKGIVETSRKSNYYQGLAYTDFSTSLLNRAAFYRDMERIFLNATERASLTLILMDINNLKLINDKYGHLMGDKAIVSMKSCMLKSFVDIGSCYRTGGDEFAVICLTEDKKKVDAAIDRFNSEADKINALGEFPFSVAVGKGEVSDLLQDKPDTIINTVDKLMYEEKQKMKKSAKAV